MEKLAVEWLAQKYFEDYDVSISELDLEEAKEMENEQKDEFALDFLVWCNSKESVDLINNLQIVGELDGEYTAIQLLEIFKNK